MPCIKPSPDELQMNRKGAMTALREQHMFSLTVEQEDLEGTATVLQAWIGKQASIGELNTREAKERTEEAVGEWSHLTRLGAKHVRRLQGG